MIILGSIVMTVVKMVSKHARPCADKELEILQIATQNERDPLQYCMIRCVVSSLGCACSADPELSSVYAGTGGSSTVHRITTPENHPTKRLERALLVPSCRRSYVVPNTSLVPVVPSTSLFAPHRLAWHAMCAWCAHCVGIAGGQLLLRVAMPSLGGELQPTFVKRMCPAAAERDRKSTPLRA